MHTYCTSPHPTVNYKNNLPFIYDINLEVVLARAMQMRRKGIGDKDRSIELQVPFFRVFFELQPSLV